MKAITELTVQQKCAQDPWCRQTGHFLKFGAVPEWLESIGKMMPDGSPEKQDYFDAAEMARGIYRRQVLATLDPSDVEALCANEPWTTASSVLRIGESRYGYVTEKLERAANLFPDGSQENTAYRDAFSKAKLIYFKHMHDMCRSYATGKTRAQIEKEATHLWLLANTFEGDGTYRMSRLIKVCELMGDYQRGFSPGSPEKVAAIMERDGYAHLVVREKFDLGSDDDGAAGTPPSEPPAPPAP